MLSEDFGWTRLKKGSREATSLQKKNIKDRLIFCKMHRDRTAEDWGKVISSDEASLRLFGASGKMLSGKEKVGASISPVSCHQ